MQLHQLIIITLAVTFGFFHYGTMDGQKDHGETCSLRSQIANVFRSNDSPEGCMSTKGLVCLNNKCVCADPSNVYEVVQPTSDSSDTASSISSAASSFFKKLVNRGGSSSNTETGSSTTPATPVSGKCVGRAMSPCFTQNSTCVKHAICGGTPRVCKCQGIYSSDTTGHCSKSASVLNQVVKSTVG